MRTLIAGTLVASIYTLAIGILLSMSMPSRAQIEAYFGAAQPVAASVTLVPALDATPAS